MSGEESVIVRAQRRSPPRGYPLILVQCLDRGAAEPRERMARARDYGEGMVEQMFLHDVGRRQRIAQRAHDDVDVGRPQSGQQVWIGALDDFDGVLKISDAEFQQRGGQQVTAHER